MTDQPKETSPVRPLRVVMVTGAYFPEISGAGLQCRSLIRAANGDGLLFSVVTTCLERGLPFRGSVDSVPVYRLPVGSANPGALTFLRWLPRLVWLKWCVFLRADIIHLHGFSRKSWLFVLFRLWPGKRVLLKLTSLGEDDPASIRKRGALSRLFYSLADRYLAPGEALARAYLASGFPEAKLVRLPNGVDTDRFRPAEREERLALRAQLGLPLEGVLVLSVGHFSEEKRPHLTAECWSCLGDGPLSLVMIGRTAEGSYEVDPRAVERVRAAAAKPGRPGELVLVESTSRIEDYYRAADIFVLSSVREGQPNALLEAMACGLACAASRLEGVTDSLLEDGGAGLLFEPDNARALCSALERLADNPTLREILGRRAREVVLAGYAMEEVAARYRNLCFGLYGRDTAEQ
ncbi:glycosyltransferase family 4 protein [bacterium]|nr:glycosyltransferase family 4 protein [bacterium]